LAIAFFWETVVLFATRTLSIYTKNFASMKNLWIAVGILGLFITSCRKISGEGPVVTETRDVSGFTGIDLRMSGDVIVKQDSVYKVEASAQQNILDHLEIYKSNDKLVVKLKDNVSITSHEQVTVTVSTPVCNDLRLSGSGTISTDALTPAELDVDVSGSGNIVLLKLTATKLDATVSGSGSILVQNGTLTEEALKISGSGKIDLTHVAAAKATTKTTGSGDMWINLTENLDATITGSGSVYYKGNPVVDTHITGSGKVVHF
jgi:hypothetical protein